MTELTRKLLERLEESPEGKVRIKETRIGADAVLGMLLAGDQVSDILVAYPKLDRDDVLACIAAGRQALDCHGLCWTEAQEACGPGVVETSGAADLGSDRSG